MTMRLGSARKNAACDSIVDALDGGTIEIWSGAQPGSVGGSEGGNTKLGTLTFGTPAFGNAGAVGPLGSGSQPATVGRAYANAITSDTDADASATAGHFLAKTSGGVVAFDGTCGQGTGDGNFDIAVIITGGTIACSSFYVQV